MTHDDMRARAMAALSKAAEEYSEALMQYRLAEVRHEESRDAFNKAVMAVHDLRPPNGHR